MEDLIGKTLLNRYLVEDFVGRGGMAEVYRARDMRRRIIVALKFLRDDMAEDEIFLRRFRREARVLETLQHPNIVRYYGFEEDDNLHFLVVEFIQGEGLRKKLSQLARPLTLEQTLAILEPVCNALHYAHAEGIAHCDIKPANIMIEKSGRVVVADFGIAKLAESATITSSSTGTPAYMAPEQCRGHKVDSRTDVYALAITTFEMLTLDRPFTGENATIQGAVSERIRWEQLKAPPPSTRKYNPEIPDWADRAILKALEKPRNRRFATVLAFYHALSNAGKVVPDPILPWTETEPADSLTESLVERSTPRGSTRSTLWEQRLTDAWWTARRTYSRLSAQMRQFGVRLRLQARPRLRNWFQVARGRLAQAAHRRYWLPRRTLAYALVGAVALVAVGFVAWQLSDTDATRNMRVTPTAEALSPTTHPPTLQPTHTLPPASLPAATPGTPVAPAAAFLTITSKGANIRSGPATAYPIVATAELGATFGILARSPMNDWYQVCCLQGEPGWVHTGLVEVKGNADALPAITPQPPPPQQIGAAPSGAGSSP